MSNSLLQPVEAMVMAINDETDAENVCDAIDRIDNLKRQLKELDKLFKEQLIDWINANGELTIGSNRYYVGSTKRTRPINMERLTDAAITACNGDFGAFVEALSANAYKPGACKKILGDEWSNHFTVDVVEDVKTGKPKKSVQVVNERFIK